MPYLGVENVDFRILSTGVSPQFGWINKGKASYDFIERSIPFWANISSFREART
jgi:hypothetical protein